MFVVPFNTYVYDMSSSLLENQANDLITAFTHICVYLNFIYIRFYYVYKHLSKSIWKINESDKKK